MAILSDEQQSRLTAAPQLQSNDDWKAQSAGKPESIIPADMPGTTGEKPFIPDVIKSKSDKPAMPGGMADTAQSQQKPANIDELVGYVRQQFQRAMISRNRVCGDITPLKGVDNRFIDCQRRRAGIYDSDTAAAIEAQGGTKRYHKITEPKIASALATMTNVLKRSIGLPYAIKPPPLAELPDQHQDAIRQQILEIREALYQHGEDVKSPQALEAIFQMYEDAYDRQVQRIQKEADLRADRMQQKVERQLDEGDWDRAIRDFLDCFVTYHAACFKGPYLEGQLVQEWEGGKLVKKVKPVLKFRNVNPQDGFPCPNARDIPSSWFIELLRMDKTDLASFRGQPGYSKENIEKALKDANGLTLTALLPINEPLRAAIENRDTTINNGVADTDIIGLEYWGPVPGHLLKDWNIIPEDADEFEPYQVTVIIFGSYCVKAVLNPHPLGKNPYRMTSWRKLPGDVWLGKALCELMDDLQDNCAATVRALVNNLAFASGPMMGLDRAAIDPANLPPKLTPWMQIWFNSKDAAPQGRILPVIPIKIDCNARELMDVASWFKREADDRTGIPDFNHGGTDVQGAAGNTAKGMELFINQSSAGSQQVLCNIDEDVFCAVIKEIVRWNNENLPDDQYASLKGDYIVEARGYLGRIVHEELQNRRLMFARMTQNPQDLEIMGVVNGRVTLLRAIAKDLDLPLDDLVPSIQQYQAYMLERQQAARMAAMPPQGGPGAPAAPAGGMAAPAQAPQSLPPAPGGAV